jgi:hypothetical protein
MCTESTASRRTPEWSTHNNNADNIERYLQEDGHRTWGFVIYRCTYESDNDWDQFMERLRYHIRHTLKVYNGLDMMNSLSITVIEDRSILDDASTSVVREHFKQWAATAPQQEQGAGPGLSQRYRYCVQVDADALEAVVYDAPTPPEIDTTTDGFVNLIWKDWGPELFRPNPRFPGPEEEPIEGCTLHNVGWMRVAYQDLMVDMYYYLRDYNDWYREYRRPPEVARA